MNVDDCEQQAKFLRDVANVVPMAAYRVLLRRMAEELNDVAEALEFDGDGCEIRSVGSVMPGETVFYRKDIDDRVGWFLVVRRVRDGLALQLYDHDYPAAPIWLDRLFPMSPVLVKGTL